MSISIARSDQARPVAHRRTTAAAAAVAPLWPALFLFYSTLIPMEVRFSVADQTIYPPRMAAFILLPWIINKLSSGAIRFRLLDGLVAIGVVWMIVSFMLYYDAGSGFLRSAPLAFDVVAPYLVARCTIRSLTDLRRFLIYASPGIAIAGLSMAIESITRTPIVKPFAAGIFGRLAIYENGVAVGDASFVQQARLGLLRASGPFAHPILGGTYLAALFPAYFWSGIKGWPRRIGLIGALCGIFSLSSGAFLVFLLGIGAMVADYAQRKLSFLTWRHMIGGLLIIMAFLEVVSTKGITAILIRYTLDPATGYYRQLIWQYGSASVMRHPWIGIGYTDFERLRWMGTSVDHHWLLLGIRHGLIVPIAILTAFVSVAFLLTQRASRSFGVDRLTVVAMAAVLTALIIAGVTVTYFGQMQTMFYFLFGVCMNLTAKSHQIGPRES